MIRFFLVVAFLCTANLTSAQAIYDRDARFHPVLAPVDRGMVVSQDYLASLVGAEILAMGGNAVDAAVATGFALAVTFPQAGNLGGGGFMLVHLAEENKTFALDYRETAPESFFAEMFIRSDGSVDTGSKRFGINSTGVPGTVAGLLLAQEKWGELSREQVMAPAIKLAESGFVVSDSLAYSLQRASGRFQTDQTREYFLGEDFSGPEPGDLWVQSDLAHTLGLISRQGAPGFYSGETAEKIVNQIQTMGGSMTMDDLAGYEAIVREPVIGQYRDYEVASMPPPSSGGVHLIQMLNILENADLASLEHNSSGYLHLLVEAMKPAYADRSFHLGDPDFVSVPVGKLTSQDYADELWAEISPEQARPSESIAPFVDVPEESADTTHFSVWDAEGNVVSNTYTLNFSYGNGIAVNGAGFLLNNEMDDFSAKPGATNAYGLIGSRANSIEPGKRPLSSMTPTIVFRDGAPFMATGSPGGSRIITTVLQSILNATDHGMNAAETVSVPRIHHQWYPDQIYWESGVSVDTRRVMQALGHSFSDAPRTFAKLEVILKTESGLQGASDPRWPASGAVVQPDSGNPEALPFTQMDQDSP